MNKKLLVIGFVWPEPKSSAAGSRMLQLITQFQKQGYVVSFACAAKISTNTFDLAGIGVTTKAILLNDACFDVFVSELKPNVVLFDRFMVEEQYGWRVAEQYPDALRILDTEDFHGLRKARGKALKEATDMSLAHLHNNTTKREIASIYRCDLSLIISEAEMDILRDQFKIDASLLCYLPFLVAPVTSSDIEKLPTFEERQHFITIGNFLHEPNYDAVLYLKQSIWPLLKKQLPQATLHIYGAYESQKVTQLHHEKEGFLIKGFAEDVNSVMQNAKVCLAALRFGAGLKGKLIDAMQNGTPCGMTTIAAEGMFGHIAPNGFIEDAPEHFVAQAVALYQDETLWNQAQQQGFKVLNQRFDVALFEAAFFNRLTELLKDLKTHRQRNFMGQLLQHQTLQSTKYMSKWIAAKNEG